MNEKYTQTIKQHKGWFLCLKLYLLYAQIKDVGTSA